MPAEHGGRRPGAGRPKREGPAPVQFSVTLPPELLAKLDAARGEDSRNAFVVALLKRALE